MSQHLAHQVIFRPASEKPTAEMAGKNALVYNLCDGWHEGTIHVFEDDGEVWHVGIYAWGMEEFAPNSFYIAWALLPDNDDIDKHFAEEKHKITR
ncbi:hypothetical protein NG99_16945 [Erwinia typographi]|uniref:DUF551 domain-containing protein n=1 Tax=Erwinia typographi TaxID=371042 RepID=A0A0A4A055_9GAMM|nr:hypothetical protein [Erwinia typographi]KGT91253.1 hypothetical protein NG99_16945 [Erwinia typographi]